jgi:hypothetical protein
VLPAEGQTSEPEDTGPMVPPRPEPVAPPRVDSGPSRPEPVAPASSAQEPSGGLLSKIPSPAVVGSATALVTLLILLVRRRRR